MIATATARQWVKRSCLQSMCSVTIKAFQTYRPRPPSMACHVLQDWFGIMLLAPGWNRSNFGSILFSALHAGPGRSRCTVTQHSDLKIVGNSHPENGQAAPYLLDPAPIIGCLEEERMVASRSSTTA